MARINPNRKWNKRPALEGVLAGVIGCVKPDDEPPFIQPQLKTICVEIDGEVMEVCAKLDLNQDPPTSTYYDFSGNPVDGTPVPCPKPIDWEFTPDKPLCLENGEVGYCTFSLFDPSGENPPVQMYKDPFGAIIPELPSDPVPCEAGKFGCGPLFEVEAPAGFDQTVSAGTATHIYVDPVCADCDATAVIEVTIDCQGTPMTKTLTCNDRFHCDPGALINFDVQIKVIEGTACVQTYTIE